jgi:hypothetical protein
MPVVPVHDAQHLFAVPPHDQAIRLGLHLGGQRRRIHQVGKEHGQRPNLASIAGGVPTDLRRRPDRQSPRHRVIQRCAARWIARTFAVPWCQGKLTAQAFTTSALSSNPRSAVAINQRNLNTSQSSGPKGRTIEPGHGKSDASSGQVRTMNRVGGCKTRHQRLDLGVPRIGGRATLLITLMRACLTSAGLVDHRRGTHAPRSVRGATLTTISVLR